jgi:hypothetical protein
VSAVLVPAVDRLLQWDQRILMLVSDGTAAVIRDDLGPAQTIRSGFADERFRRSLAAQRAPGRRASTSSPEFDVASDADVAAPVDRATPSVQIDAEGKRRHQLGEPNLVGVLIHLVTISASQVATTGTAVAPHPAAARIRVIHEGAGRLRYASVGICAGGGSHPSRRTARLLLRSATGDSRTACSCRPSRC